MIPYVHLGIIPNKYFITHRIAMLPDYLDNILILQFFYILLKTQDLLNLLAVISPYTHMCLIAPMV